LGPGNDGQGHPVVRQYRVNQAYGGSGGTQKDERAYTHFWATRPGRHSARTLATSRVYLHSRVVVKLTPQPVDVAPLRTKWFQA
jgi:hypothetical protein